MPARPQSRAEANLRARFAEQLVRLQAVFQSLPSDMAIPYLGALDKLRDEREVARLASKELQQRARRSRKSTQATVAARIRDIKAQQPPQTTRVGAALDELRMRTRDWLAERLAAHGAIATVAHDTAARVTQQVAREAA